jgi:hypothetical protein
MHPAPDALPYTRVSSNAVCACSPLEHAVIHLIITALLARYLAPFDELNKAGQFLR